VGKDEAVMRTYGSSPVKLKFSFHSASEARPTGSDKNPHLAYLTVVAPLADTNEGGRPAVCQPWRDLPKNIGYLGYQRSGVARVPRNRDVIADNEPVGIEHLPFQPPARNERII
jgi:hypothetical protein